MSDWENEDLPNVPVPVKGQWDDEDVNQDDIKDSWDASDSEDQDKPSPTSATSTAPKKKKKALAEKIAERQQEEEKKKLEMLKLKNETEGERKQRLQKQIVESDMDNAKDLFAGLNVTSAIGLTNKSKLDSLDPKSSAEFDEFKNLLMERITPLESRIPYAAFVENLMRDLIIPLKVDDIRKLSSTLTAMMNEKQKQAKESSKKKKNTKKTVKTMPGGDLDTTNYDDVYDDFDDFM